MRFSISFSRTEALLLLWSPSFKFGTFSTILSSWKMIGKMLLIKHFSESKNVIGAWMSVFITVVNVISSVALASGELLRSTSSCLRSRSCCFGLSLFFSIVFFNFLLEMVDIILQLNNLCVFNSVLLFLLVMHLLLQTLQGLLILSFLLSFLCNLLVPQSSLILLQISIELLLFLMMNFSNLLFDLSFVFLFLLPLPSKLLLSLFLLPLYSHLLLFLLKCQLLFLQLFFVLELLLFHFSLEGVFLLS